MTNPKGLLKKLQQKFDAFNLPIVDPWKRVDGVRIMLSPSGYGLREDGIGKLVCIDKNDFVIGRDGRRALRVQRDEAKHQSELLAAEMRVHRSHVVGKEKCLKSRPATKRECAVEVISGGGARKTKVLCQLPDSERKPSISIRDGGN